MSSVVGGVGKSGIGDIVMTAFCGSRSVLFAMDPWKIGNFCVDSVGVCSSSELSIGSCRFACFGESFEGGW